MAIAAGVWGLVELGLSIADAIETWNSLKDPCAGWGEKSMVVGAFVGGFFAPGGGYSIATKKGFKTIKAFKKVHGKAGRGKNWHHIVEANQEKYSGFAKELIHHRKNVVKIDAKLHNKISGHYASKADYANKLRVREWLRGKSFEFQYNYGLMVLRQYGVKLR